MSEPSKKPRWTEGDVSYLREHYAEASNASIAEALGRTVKSVVAKAHNLKLRKSEDRLRAMGAENVAARWERPTGS